MLDLTLQMLMMTPRSVRAVRALSFNPDYSTSRWELVRTRNPLKHWRDPTGKAAKAEGCQTPCVDP